METSVNHLQAWSALAAIRCAPQWCNHEHKRGNLSWLQFTKRSVSDRNKITASAGFIRRRMLENEFTLRNNRSLFNSLHHDTRWIETTHNYPAVILLQTDVCSGNSWDFWIYGHYLLSQFQYNMIIYFPNHSRK